MNIRVGLEGDFSDSTFGSSNHLLSISMILITDSEQDMIWAVSCCHLPEQSPEEHHKEKKFSRGRESDEYNPNK